MDSFQAHLLTAIGTFLAGIGISQVTRSLEPKAKIVWWSPRRQLFEVPITPVPIEESGTKSVVANPEKKSDLPVPIENIVKKEAMVVPNPAVGQPPLLILVTTIFIQNVGKKTAEAVELCYREKPEHFKLFPSFDYDEHVTPDGAFILRIKALGPKETVAVEGIAFVRPPVLNYIRCSNAPTEELVRWFYTRVYPQWMIIFIWSLAAVGAAFVVGCLSLIILSGLGIYTLPHIGT